MFKTFTVYWRSHIMPSPAALAFVSVAGALVALALACSTIYGLSAGTSPADSLERFAFTFGVMGLPFVALLLLVGSARDKRPLPRGLMIGSSALIILLGGFFTSLAMGLDSEVSLVASSGLFLLFFAPAGIVLLGIPSFSRRRDCPSCAPPSQMTANDAPSR